MASQWTINAARSGQNCQFTLSSGEITHGPFVVSQPEALSLAGMIQGLYGGGTATSASVTATGSPGRPKKGAARRTVARR